MIKSKLTENPRSLTRNNKKKKKLQKIKRINVNNIEGKVATNVEEKLLEDIVFNTNASLLSEIDKNVNLVSVNLTKNLPENEDIINDLFVVDRTGDESINIDFEVHEDLQELPDSNIDKEKLSESFQSPRRNQTIIDNQQELVQVWRDEDDEMEASEGLKGCVKFPKLLESNDKYKQYLERKFTSIYEPPNWARKALEQRKGESKRSNHDTSDSEDEDLIERTAFDQIKSSRIQLDKDFLRVKKCNHLNISSRIKTSLNCINFHPNSTIALIGSQIGLIRLFQVDGKLNSIIQSIYFQGYRLCDAKFISTNGREEIIVGSDGSNAKSKGYCYYYDMIAGKIVRVRLSKGDKNHYSLRGFQISPNLSYLAACDDNGNINLLTVSSKELIQEMKVNGEVNCLSFSPDSNYLLAHGHQNGCQAFIFDIRNTRSSIPCVNRFNDLDTIMATSMDVSKTGSLVAIGSNVGTVNLYRFDEVLKQTNPKPVKSVLNLTTEVTSLTFNHDGQLLLMASDQKNDAIRFLNTNSMSVYKNFPLFVGGGSGRTYGRIHDLDFSPNSGYVSFVTGYGTAHLFRVNEYSSY